MTARPPRENGPRETKPLETDDGRSQFAELFGRAAGQRFEEPEPPRDAAPERRAPVVEPPDTVAERGETSFYETAPVWLGVARGLAGVFGGLCLHAAFGPAKRAGFDGRLGWLDLSPLFGADAAVALPDAAAPMGLSAAGAVLGLFVVRPQLPGVLRWAVLAAVSAGLPFAAWSAANACRSAGGFTPSLPLHVVACLVTLLLAVRATPRGPLAFGVGQPLAAAAAVLACGLSFPLVDDPPPTGDRGVVPAARRTAAWWARTLATPEGR